MLLRIFQADVKRGHEATFFVGLADATTFGRAVTGLQSVHVGRQMTDATQRVIITSTWTDFASLQRAVGKDWQRSSFLPPDLGALVENVQVSHYEIVAEHKPGVDPAARRSA